MARQEEQSLDMFFNASEGLTSDSLDFAEVGSVQFQLNATGSDNQYMDGVVNPIRFPGFLSPALKTLDNITSPTTEPILASVVDIQNQDLYFGEFKSPTGSSSIMRLTTTTDDSVSSAFIIGYQTANTNALQVTDMAEYELNGTRGFYYAFNTDNDNTGGDVGFFDPTSFTNIETGDTLSSATNGFNTGNNNVRLRPADNGFMYILDGSAVHKFDGTTAGGSNGEAEENVLKFPGYFQTTDALDYAGFLWITVVGTTRDIITTNLTAFNSIFAGVFVWNRQSRVVNMSDFIPIPGQVEIRAIFLYDGVPHVLTRSSNSTTQLRRYEGSKFSLVHEFSGDGYPNHPSSIFQNGRIVYWQGKEDGIIYAYGRVRAGSRPGFFKIGDLTADTNTSWTNGSSEGGILTGFGADASATSLSAMVATFEDDNGGQVRRFNPHKAVNISGQSSNALSGGFKSIVKPLPKLSHVTGMTLYFPPQNITNSNRYMTASIFKNRGTASIVSKSLTGDDAARGWKYISLNESNTNYIQVGFDYDENREVYPNIYPEYAEIHYVPKQKLK